MYFVVCLCWARVGTILGLSCTILGYVGPLWAMSAPYWAHVEPFWCILWLCWPLLGKSWDHILAMLGHFGPRWHHIWLMLSHFSGILWFVLALVGQELGPYWAYLGPFWAMLGHFGPCWHHIGLILGHFGLFSDLCRPLFRTWAFSVVEFSSMQRVCKKCHKYQGKKGCVADGFCCYLFVVFVSFFYGMLHLGYACLISG